MRYYTSSGSPPSPKAAAGSIGVTSYGGPLRYTRTYFGTFTGPFRYIHFGILVYQYITFAFDVLHIFLTLGTLLTRLRMKNGSMTELRIECPRLHTRYAQPLSKRFRLWSNVTLAVENGGGNAGGRHRSAIRLETNGRRRQARRRTEMVSDGGWPRRGWRLRESR